VNASQSRLERRYRLLLRCYPRSWREHREEEAVGLLIEQAAAEQRSTVGVRTAIDLVGHGIEARLDTALGWLPWRLREQIATAALVVVAGLSLLMLVGEIIAAHIRTASGEVLNGNYFSSGPFLSMGVGMYLGYMTAAVLCVVGRAGPARLLVLLTTAYAAACVPCEVWFRGYPGPRLLILVPSLMFGVLAALATIRTSRSSARRLIKYGAVLVAGVGIAFLITKPFVGWSIGTATTSGNVAFGALATALPFICAAALAYASLTAARRPGWLTATAVTIFPLVVFCTAVNQIVTGPNRSDAILLTPLYYLAVLLATIAHRRGHRRPLTN
jgi:hypothetical protein